MTVPQPTNSMRRAGSLAVIALVSMSFALVGCTPATTDASPTPSATVASPGPAVEASSEPSATPGTEPPAGDDARDWTLSAVGYGPLRVGEAFDAATTEVGPYVRFAQDCADPEFLRFSSDELGFMAVVLDDGMSTVESIWVSADGEQVTGPATESGIGLGSDLATVLTAYPNATLSRETAHGGTYAVASGPTFLTFAIDQGVVVSMAAAASGSPFREYCS